jgi:phosphate transport system permease protein
MRPLPDPTAPLRGSGTRGRRGFANFLFEFVATGSALLAVGVLALVVGTVIGHGASALSIDFLIKDPPRFGGPGGGIAPAIVGTAILAGMATAISMPIAILVAIYLTEFASPRPAGLIRLALDVLNGLPTVVVGLFVYGLLVAGHHQSGFAGAIALAIIMLPLIARASQEMLRLVPDDMRHAADALGVSRWRTILTVVLPSVMGGVATGTVLALARAAGETAPLIFLSSIYGNGLLTNPFGGALPNIPFQIFSLSEQADSAGYARAWGAAVVLLAFILLANIGARAVLARSRARLAA